MHHSEEKIYCEARLLVLVFLYKNGNNKIANDNCRPLESRRLGEFFIAILDTVYLIFIPARLDTN